MTSKTEDEEIRFGRRVYSHDVKTSAAQRLFPTYGGGMSSRTKAEKFAAGKAEVVMKFDKTSVKSAHHLQESGRYISRNGKLECEDDEGQVLAGTEAIDDRMKSWVEDDELYKQTGAGRPSDKLARRFIVSTPPGTDPEALKKAVRDFVAAEFKSRGFEFIWTIHTDKAHPHAHVLIKNRSADGKRLHYSNRDLRAMRERFCVIAEQYGIDLNATSRAVRGKTRRDKPIERFYQEQRGSQHIYEKYRIEELVKVLKSGGELDEPELMKRCRMTRQEIRKNAAEYVEELRQTGKSEDLALAVAIEKKISEMPPVESAQEERLRKAKSKIARKKQQRTEAEKARAERIKEAIRQRKAAEKAAEAKAAEEESENKRIEQLIAQKCPTASRDNIEHIRNIIKQRVEIAKQQGGGLGIVDEDSQTLNGGQEPPQEPEPPKKGLTR
ncbi:MAG: relaxase/mobilization nuclease domain-containing protein [Succinivibrionaceae bacterium]|nr:relaxase/mobilization nuclease domain-containing protein [Succinivibrionaceae bacterium]